MIQKTSFIFLIFLIYVAQGYSQQKGITFDSNLTWKEVKEKAKIENKYIFVDCFATWCGPCKLMDKNVYSNDSVGRIFASEFICIRLQMDQTENDNPYVKSWFNTSQEFLKSYAIDAYPSLLFFSPNGDLVHKTSGYQDPVSLIKLGNDAKNPDRQYFSLKKKYEKGEIKSEKNLRNLLSVAQENGDYKFSNVVSAKFKKDFLDNLSPIKVCTKENIDFIYYHLDLIRSSDNFFIISYKWPQRIDSIQQGLSQKIIDHVIEKEEITEKIWKGNSIINSNPNWENIYAKIQKKYGKKYAEKLVPPANKFYSFKTGNWKEFARLQDLEISKKNYIDGTYYPKDSWDLNMAAWKTYLKCSDSIILKRALIWSDLSIKIGGSSMPNPTEQYYDTKARILYKLGRASEAIETEQKAIDTGIKMAEFQGSKEKSMFFDEYNTVLRKMKSNSSIDELN